MERNILVTGGCGFIGSNLVKKLLSLGNNVTVYDNLSRGYIFHLDGFKYDFIKGDVRDLDSITKATRNKDIVIHLAAFGSVIESINSPFDNFSVNVQGTLNVLNACVKNKVGKFIFASTGGALIGNANPPVDEGSLPKPISPYGASKLCGEAYCSAFSSSYDIQTICLRFANVYGRNSSHKMGAITKFIKNILKGEPINIYGDGNASRDFLHVDDLCNGIILSYISKISPLFSVFHLSSGVETTISKLAHIILEISKSENHSINYFPSRRGEVTRNFASFKNAHNNLGFSPTISLENGLIDLWSWFKNLPIERLNL